VETRDSLLGGRYRVIRVLGSGGMATVFLCEDDRLGRSVAVKRLHAHSPAETAQRFVREARLGASLNHPNIVSVYDTVTDEQGVLIVMELVPGENLADALRKGPLGTERALSVVHDVAAALDHAHGHGVIHRDIKPANVLLRDDGLTKLVDLGIATAADQTKITRSGIVLGTAAYMAPEQLEGGETGPHTDIYSLAVVAYEALSGKRARSGRTPMEIAHQVATEGPPDLNEVWSLAPPEAAAVLCRGMAKHPADRPGSAGALAQELEEALEGVGDTKPTRRATGALGAAAAGAAGAAEADGARAADPTPTRRQARRPQAQPPPEPEAERQRKPAAPRAQRRAPAPAAKSAGAGKRRPGLAVALAALLLALAAVVGLAALSSGGDDERQAADSGSQKQAPKEKGGDGKQRPGEQPAAEDQQPQQAAPPAPASGGGRDPARGAQLDAQAFGLIKQGKYAEAVPIARRAVASFHENDTSANYAYALFNLGTALSRSGHPKQAIPYFEKRLRFSNDRPEVVRAELERARRAAGS